ncbi:hypothetical protein Tco_1007249 [Tanacetum coccineum]
MSCGALYTRNRGCSKGGIEDKILVPKPPQNCTTCGDPVNGLYCRSCAFVRKCLNEGWYTIHDGNTCESSNHNTNIVSAPQEPFVFNQDPGVNSSQSPPQSNHNCCYECGDSLDGIFCQRCTCKYCGKGAHIGYNCPPKAPIISNPKQCNQNIDEIPQTLPSVNLTCNSGNENLFTYDSKPIHNLLCILVNFARTMLVTVTIKPTRKEGDGSSNLLHIRISPINDDEEARGNFFGRRKIKDALMDKKYQPEDIQELMSKLLEDFPIPSEFKVYPKYTLIFPCPLGEDSSTFDALSDHSEILSNSNDDGTSSDDDSYENIEYVEASPLNLEIVSLELFYFDNDDDEYTVIWRRPKAITPDEPSEEPEDPLIMGKRNLALFLKRINLIDFLFEEFAGELAPIPPGMDKDEFDEEEDDCYDDDTSSDDDSFENIDYVEASPPDSELVSLEEVEDVILRDKLSNVYLLISKIEALNDNPTLSSFSYSDNSFSDHTKETRSGSSTTHANNSLPENDSFLFEIEPDQGGLTGIVISNNSNNPILELPEFESFHFDLAPSFPRPPPEPPDVEISLIIETDAPVINNFDELNEDECFDPGGDEIDVEDNDSFTFVTWIFLPYLTYPEVSPLLSSTKNEDTIFDPDISI